MNFLIFFFLKMHMVWKIKLFRRVTLFFFRLYFNLLTVINSWIGKNYINWAFLLSFVYIVSKYYGLVRRKKICSDYIFANNTQLIVISIFAYTFIVIIKWPN